MTIKSSIFAPSVYRVGRLFFDGVMSETHNYSVVSTDNPIEVGANITDHAYVAPREVTLDIMVGDIYQSFTTPSAYNLSKRSSDALNKLNLLMVLRQPLTVICNLAKYDNLLMTGISVNQNKENNSTLMATLSFKEILLVNSNAGDININNNNDQYQKPKRSGTKPLRPA